MIHEDARFPREPRIEECDRFPRPVPDPDDLMGLAMAWMMEGNSMGPLEWGLYKVRIGVQHAFDRRAQEVLRDVRLASRASQAASDARMRKAGLL